MKICKICSQEKNLEEFVKQKNSYRSTCKECKNKKRRTGIPNVGRFKNSQTPWNKAKNGYETKSSSKVRTWSNLVKERDGYRCTECHTVPDNPVNLHSHHIIPWKLDKSKRFDVNNGITLCASCHNKQEAIRVAGWNKGTIRTESWRKNLGNALKGKTPWNKGVKMSEDSKKKLSESLKGRISWNKGKKNPGTGNSGTFQKGQIPWNKKPSQEK